MKVAKKVKTLSDRLALRNKPENLRLLRFGYLGSEFFGLKTEPILSMNKKIMGNIGKMAEIAAKNNFCCISAPQVFKDMQLFLMAKYLDGNWISIRYADKSAFDTYINPKITKISEVCS